MTHGINTKLLNTDFNVFHGSALSSLLAFSETVYFSRFPDFLFQLTTRLSVLHPHPRVSIHAAPYLAQLSLRFSLSESHSFSLHFSSDQSLSRVWLFATPRTAARQASLSITNSQSLPKPMPTESVMPSNHLILCCPQYLPALGSFLMSQLFSWGNQGIGISASTSVLPMNTQDWSPLGWTGWIFLQSKGLSRVFYNTTVQKHQFFGAQLSSPSNSHIHTWLLEKP